MWKRFRAYLIGVLIGCVVVFFYYGERLTILTSWLPTERVKTDILLYIQESEVTTCATKCADWDYAKILSAIDEAEVNFSESETTPPNRVYLLETEEYQMKFAVQDSTAQLVSIGSCLCEN